MTKNVSKLPISVCIIGYNEEKKVEDCLKSVKDLVEEIVFIDSYSTDKTLEIVRKYTSKIYKKKFMGYVKQKNFAAAKASNTWVLNLDCDERLSSNAIVEIREAWQKLNGSDGYSCCSFPRLTFYIYRWIRHSGWYPDRKIRLYNKHFVKWVGDQIHESIKIERGRTFVFKGDILHYSFDSIDDHLDTIKKFSSIAAREAYDAGKRTNILSIIGRSFWVLFRKLVFEFSYLDGAAGIIITGLSATATWAKYAKLYILQKR